MALEDLSDAELDQMLLNAQAPKAVNKPSRPLEEMSDEELDQMLLSNQGQSDIKEPNPIMAGLESFGKEATFGYLPQIQAGLESLMPQSNTDRQLEAQGFQLPDQGYAQLRDENILRQQKLQKENPTASLTGTIAGALASSVPVAKVAGLAGKGVSLGGRLLRGAGTGAAVARLQNPGDTEGQVEPLQVAERFDNAKSGALTGLAFQGLGEGLSRIATLAKNAPDKLKKFSDAITIKSTGAFGATLKKQMKTKDIEGIVKTINERGLVKIGDSLDDIAKKAGVLRQEQGQKIGEIYSRLNAKTTDPEFLTNLTKAQRKSLTSSNFYGNEMVKELEKKIGSEFRNQVGDKNFRGLAKNVLDDIASLGDDINLKDMQEIKRSIDGNIQWDKTVKESPGVQKQMRLIRDFIDEKIKKRVGVFDEILKGSDLDELKAANKLFSHSKTVETNALDRIQHEAGNRFFSLGDRVSGGAGAIVGAASAENPEEALKRGLIGFFGGQVAGRAGRLASSPVAANSLRRLSEAMRIPANFAKYGQPLIEASLESPAAIQTVLQQLKNDPEFNKLSKPKTSKGQK
jgi:hypothetical protein